MTRTTIVFQSHANLLEWISFLGDSVIDFIPEYVLDISSPDMSPEAAREWFMLEDRNGDSYVAKSELLTIAENLGMSPDQAEDSVSSYYMSADANKDEQLSFQGENAGQGWMSVWVMMVCGCQSDE